jgi:hypothetical protein
MPVSTQKNPNDRPMPYVPFSMPPYPVPWSLDFLSVP